MERLKLRRPKYLAPEFWVLLPTSWVTLDKSLPWGSVFSCKKKNMGLEFWKFKHINSINVEIKNKIAF